MVQTQTETIILEQQHVWKLLQNTIKKRRLSHAYLFSGCLGTETKEVALLLAQAIFCPEASENKLFPGCGRCGVCLRISHQNHPDVFLFEPEGQSIKKEVIQFIQELVSKKGVESDTKVVIIDQIDKMTLAAANSFLKMLEDATEGMYFILLTNDLNNVLATITSRCQVIDFKLNKHKLLIEQLEQKSVPKERALLFSEVTDELEVALSYEQDNWFADAINLSFALFDISFTCLEDAYLFINMKWIKHFNTRERVKVGLELLILLYRDSWNLHLNREVAFFNLFSKTIPNKAKQSTLAELSKRVHNIMHAQQKLRANSNCQLLMEALIINLDDK